MPTLAQLQKSKREQQARIDAMIGALERLIDGAGAALVESMVSGFAEKLDAEKGAILNTLQNQRLTAIIDKVYKTFNEKQNIRVVAHMADGIAEINALNSEHFKQLYTKPLAPVAATVQAVVNNRFGIGADGNLLQNGYMMGMLDDETVRNQIKQFAFKAIQSGTGYNDFKNKLADYIKGNPERAGIFQRFYRNYAYDVYSQVDRLNGQQYADRLKLNYAIFEGGIIETTRIFCKEHNGKVYSRAEIAAMDIKEAKPPNYDPFTDMGGYGCRHTWNWIPDALALALRPELAGQRQPAPAPGPVPAPPAPPVPVPKPPKPVGNKPVPEPPPAPAPSAGNIGSPNYKERSSPSAIAEYITDNLAAAHKVDFSGLDNKPSAEVLAELNKAASVLTDLFSKYRLTPLESFSVITSRGTANASFYTGIENGKIEVRASYLTKPLQPRADRKSVMKNYQDILQQQKDKPELFNKSTRLGKGNLKVLAAVEERTKYQRWSLSNDKQDRAITVIHETGHKVHEEYLGIDSFYSKGVNQNRIPQPERIALRQEFETLYRNSKANGDIYAISEYAGSKPAEFFAESFTMYEIEPDKLPPKIKKFFDKLLTHAKR